MTMQRLPGFHSKLSDKLSRIFGGMVANQTLVFILDRAFRTGGTYQDVRNSVNAAIGNADKLIELGLPNESSLKTMIEERMAYARASFRASLEAYLLSIPKSNED